MRRLSIYALFDNKDWKELDDETKEELIKKGYNKVNIYIIKYTILLLYYDLVNTIYIEDCLRSMYGEKIVLFLII